MTSPVPTTPESSVLSLGREVFTADCAVRTAADLSGQLDAELEELLRELLALPDNRNDIERYSPKLAEAAALAGAGGHQEVAARLRTH